MPWGLRAQQRTATTGHAHTDKPICYVINTHAHPDHVFGNIAFVAQHPTFMAHKNYAEFLGARMQTYLRNYSRMYGYKLSPDIIVPPDRTVAGTTTVNLGHRVLELTAMPTGHTNCDLVVFDKQTAALWAGDLVVVHHIPELDGSINVAGWRTQSGCGTSMPGGRCRATAR